MINFNSSRYDQSTIASTKNPERSLKGHNVVQSPNVGSDTRKSSMTNCLSYRDETHRKIQQHKKSCMSIKEEDIPELPWMSDRHLTRKVEQ